MTGTELFEALSFVDEKYIQEADVPAAGRNTPWMKVLSVVACLCILITGVYAYGRTQSKGVMESMTEQEAAAPEAVYQEAAPAEVPAQQETAPAAAAPTEDARAEKEPVAEEGFSAAAGELEQIPFVRLEIIRVLEDGKFTAVVDAVDDDPTSLEAGMELTVVVDPSRVPSAEAEIQNDLHGIGEYSLVVVENGAYDAGSNTLYAACLLASAME